MTATDTAIGLARTAGQAAADKLATDIVLIDVSDRLAITDVFVIATGNNERQVEAIVDEVEDKLKTAAIEQIDKRDCSALDKYLQPLYAEGELAQWA